MRKVEPEIALQRLTDFLVDETLAMSDEEILLEAFMSGDDTAALRDRDAALRRREAAEAEGQQPGPCEDTASPNNP